MYLPFLGVFFILWAMNPIASTAAVGITYYVSPDGIDTNSGISLLLPFKTIQQAINVAQPGDIINLKSGEYREDIVSRRDGTADNPITITGPTDAIVRGGGNDRVIEINHNYHTLNGFTVDGLYGLETKSSGYRDTLMYVLGKKVRQGVEGLKVTNMALKNSGGECLRLRYFATKAEIAHNTITNCGVRAFVFNAGGKNGEGIYLGTSNKQWGDGKNPTSDPDETRENFIHHNYIDTQGNECVDIKEGATANIIEYNTCRGQKDSESGGFDSRGDGNIFRYNDVRGSIGGGIRLGGASVNGTQYGKNNDVYENTIIDNENGGIRFQVTPQGKICGNTMSGNTNGNSAGNFGSEFDPTKSCGNNTPSDNTGNTNEPPKEPQKNTNSLANSTTLIANSNNFSDGYEALKLWDGCYDGVSYNPNTCTSGGRDISSFWLEFDFGKLYDISQSRLYGDADGEWVSKTWVLKYKKDLSDAWTVAFSDKNVFVNGWLTESLNIKARYMRVEVLGDSINFSPGRTQVRELEIYGTEIEAVTTPTNTITPPPSSAGGGSGGSSTVVPPQSPNFVTVPSNLTTTPSASGSTNQVQTALLTKPLYQGIYNEETRQLQTFLSQDASLYPEGLITGYFGLLTKKAVQRFQCKYGIICDGDESTTGYGRVGLKTLAKLNELIYKQNIPTQSVQIQTFIQKLFLGSRNNNVRGLQEFLAKDTSLYPEGLITGYFGLLTKKAVQRFQCKYGIICDGDESTTGYGRVGPKTLQKLTQLNLGSSSNSTR